MLINTLESIQDLFDAFDVGKKHGNGTAVRQLKWDSSILDVFDELRKED